MDRENVVKRFDEYYHNFKAHCIGDIEDHAMLKDVLELLKEQQNVISGLKVINDGLCEAVTEQKQIVRCRDCEDACIYSDDWVICTHIDSNGNDKHPVDWFCADGKRRECVKSVTRSATDWDGVECE